MCDKKLKISFIFKKTSFAILFHKRNSEIKSKNLKIKNKIFLAKHTPSVKELLNTNYDLPPPQIVKKKKKIDFNWIEYW